MKRDAPLVSVITPAFNSEATIGDTIESVQSQTFDDWEMVIVDDCSSDGTRKIVEAAAVRDARIRPVFLEKNGGAAVARNTALRHASGRYVAFLDADDRWKPDKLARQLSFMRAHGYAFTFTGYEYIAEDGSAVGKFVHAPERITYRDMLKNTIVGCLTVMIDREQVGAFQMPNIRTRQDLATWLSLLKKGIVAYGLDVCLSEYRIGGQASISRNKWKAAKRTWYVYRKIEGLNVLDACWYFCHYAFNAVMKRI